jgi:hypothetical protein
MAVWIAAGTRPEIVKLAPVYRTLPSRSIAAERVIKVGSNAPDVWLFKEVDFWGDGVEFRRCENRGRTGLIAATPQTPTAR